MTTASIDQGADHVSGPSMPTERVACVYDPDLGPVAVRPFPDADAKRWGKATNEGLWFAYPEDGADHYHEVWMLRLGPPDSLSGRYRFVASGGIQYGPQHAHLYGAICWAFGHGWRDSKMTLEHNIACAVEVRSNSRVLTAKKGLR